jgi:hypothetical protein
MDARTKDLKRTAARDENHIMTPEQLVANDNKHQQLVAMPEVHQQLVIIIN